MHKEDIKYNGSGYYDPTMKKALKSIISEENKQDREIYKAITVVKKLFNLWGMEVVNRIQVRDKKTGKIYK